MLSGFWTIFSLGAPVATLETVYKGLVQPYFEYLCGTPAADFGHVLLELAQVPVVMTS